MTITKDDLIKLRQAAEATESAYNADAKEAFKTAAHPLSTDEDKIEADIAAMRALDVATAAKTAYRQALEEYVKQEAA